MFVSYFGVAEKDVIQIYFRDAGRQHEINSFYAAFIILK